MNPTNTNKFYEKIQNLKGEERVELDLHSKIFLDWENEDNIFQKNL